MAACAVLVALGCGGRGDPDSSVCAGAECLAGGCEGDGEVYANGTTGIAAADGCNTCSCRNGVLACTERDCREPPAPIECEYEGRRVPDGDAFMSVDDCNSCSCHDGRVTCTIGICPSPTTCEYEGTRYADGQAFDAADGCNACSCLEGRVSCTRRACASACSTDAECGDGQYCAYPDGSCWVSGTAASDPTTERPGAGMPLPSGRCSPRPAACPQELAPVCGCNGETHESACQAARAGTNLGASGACP